MLQVPTDSIATVAPFVPPVVQMVGVVLVNTIGLADCPPVALSVKVPPLEYVMGDAGVDVTPVMVWLALVMTMLVVTCGAAL